MNKHICKICRKELKNLKLSGRHFKIKHNMTLEQYLIKFDIDYKTKNQRYLEKQNNFINKNDFVECKICGFKGKQLARHLKDRHNMTGKEYKEKYNAEIYSENLRKNMQEKNGGKNNPFYKAHPNGFDYMSEEERKEKFGSQKEKHPLWNTKRSKKTINQIRKSCSESGKKYIDSLSKDERKKKYGLPGELNPMYGKPPPDGSGRCKWFDYKNERLQGTYELRFAKFCDKNNIQWEKVHKALPYINTEGTKRTCLPDFLIYFDKNNPIYVDTKGYFDKECQDKYRSVRKKYPDKKFLIVDKKLLKQYENYIF